jgi:hypothetical protein
MTMSTLQGSEEALAKVVFGLCVLAGYAVIFGAVVYVVVHAGGS